MNQQESMQIIHEMIAISKGKFQKNSLHFIVWGSVVSLANLAHFALLAWSSYPHPYVVWLITIPTFIFSMYYGVRQGKDATASTHIDRAIGGLWIIYSVVLILIIAFGYKLNYQISALILAITAIPSTSTGMLIRYKPLIWGGVSFVIFALVTFLMENQSYHFLSSAAAIAIGYLIPGLMLKKEERQR